MNIESTGFIDTLYKNEGPLCPRSYPPSIAPEHAAVVRVQNAMYEALPRDPETDEFASEDANKLYREGAYGHAADANMRLYRHTVQAKSRLHGYVIVEELHFQCGVCGFVLPAQRAAEA